MNNSGSIKEMMLYLKLLDRSHHSADVSDNNILLDEAFISLGTAALYCKDTDTALLNYGHVKSTQGNHQQCKVKDLSHANFFVMELRYCTCTYRCTL